MLAAPPVLLMDFKTFPLNNPDHGVNKVGLLRHELGHVLGFRHEHPFALSELDGVGARVAYGMPTAWWSASITAW